MRRRTWLLILGGVGILILAAGLSLQNLARNQIRNYLDHELPPHLKLKYADLEVSVLEGSVSLGEVQLGVFRKDTLQQRLGMQASIVQLSGLKYWDYLTRDSLVFRELVIEEPELNYTSGPEASSEDTITSPNSMPMALRIEKAVIRNGSFINSSPEDSLQLGFRDLDLTISDIRTDARQMEKEIPFRSKAYEFELREVYANLSPYETMRIDSVSGSKNNVRIKNFYLGSKYGKQELSNQLTEERDYVDFRIKEIGIDSLSAGFRNERVFATARRISLHKPDIKLYRDKLLPDNLERKKMYSQLLRELPFSLRIPRLEISEGYLAYEEKTEPGIGAGSIYFDQVQATIIGIDTRSGQLEQTRVRAQANLMGLAFLELNWDFQIEDSTDTFLAYGSLRDLKSQSVNTFLKPNLGIETEGTIDQLYYTFSGDAQYATGDLKMRYKDFKITLLDKERKRVKTLLSALGNLFVNDGSKTDADGFRHGKITVERVPEKSFFNYLWISIKEGIVNSMTGDGKKEG